MAIHTVHRDFSLDVIEEKSHVVLQAIFKHSPRCFISMTALQNLKPSELLAVDFWVIDVLQNKPLCTEIALRYNIVHHSPQIILLRNATVVASETHEKVNSSLILPFL